MVRLREQIEKHEEIRLEAWACRSSQTLGRSFPEQLHTHRTDFQRDRDRILHSTAFRRLQYKTQVFVYHEGDHFRNRLTHTLEVSQIARTVARSLGANEDLTEAIVLAHDLGHTPFGHSGERILHGLLSEHGGFEHNRQGLRIVDFIEVRSGRYRGLNLCHETRAGLLKHGSDFPRYPHPVPLPQLGTSPSLEAQIANVADEIAYHNHDVDDGLRSGVLEWEWLQDVALWRTCLERATREDGGDRRTLRQRAIVGMIDKLASDLIETTDVRIRESGVESPADVCAAPEMLVAFSPDVASEVRELADFLHERMYRHPRVLGMATEARTVLQNLWSVYRENPDLLPRRTLESEGDEPRERILADYLAGMTDRFAMEEYRRRCVPDGRA